jgi:hypothetical protein
VISVEYVDGESSRGS